MFSLSQLSLCTPRCTLLSSIVIKSQAFTVKPTLLLPNLAWDCNRKATINNGLLPLIPVNIHLNDEENILTYATHADAGISINIHTSACAAHIHEQNYTPANSMAYCCEKEQNKKKEQTSKQNKLKINYKQHVKQWQCITSIDARCNGKFCS